MSPRTKPANERSSGGESRKVNKATISAVIFLGFVILLFASNDFDVSRTFVALLDPLFIINEPAPACGLPVFVMIGDHLFEERLAEIDHSLEAAVIDLQLFHVVKSGRKGIF